MCQFGLVKMPCGPGRVESKIHPIFATKNVLDNPKAFEWSKMVFEEVFFLSMSFRSQHFDAFWHFLTIKVIIGVTYITLFVKYLDFFFPNHALSLCGAIYFKEISQIGLHCDLVLKLTGIRHVRSGNNFISLGPIIVEYLGLRITRNHLGCTCPLYNQMQIFS